ERPMMLTAEAPSSRRSTFSPVSGAPRRFTPAGALMVAETVMMPVVRGAGPVVVTASVPVIDSAAATPPSVAVSVAGVVAVMSALVVMPCVAVNAAPRLVRPVLVTGSVDSTTGAGGAGKPAAVRIGAASA